jgi:hypothetical protein
MLILLVFDTATVRHLSAKTGESKRENAAEKRRTSKEKACNRLIYRLLIFLKSARDEIASPSGLRRSLSGLCTQSLHPASRDRAFQFIRFCEQVRTLLN